MSNYAELKARISIKADMIQLGEKIEWGSDSAIMREAAAAIDALERERDEAEARVKRLEKALRPFADIGIGSNPEYQPMIRLDREAILAARAALQEDKSHE